MKKITLFLVLLFALVGTNHELKAQMEYHHGAGLSYSIPISNGTLAGGSPELSYHPRLAFEINRSASFSIGAPVSLGFNFSTNSQSGTSSGSLSYGLPLTADLNLGYGCMMRSKHDFGGFVGAGYGLYGFAASSDSPFGGSTFINIHGIYAHLGARFVFNWDYRFSVSAFTFQDLDETMVYGIRLIYEFTQFR